MQESLPGQQKQTFIEKIDQKASAWSESLRKIRESSSVPNRMRNWDSWFLTETVGVARIADRFRISKSITNSFAAIPAAPNKNWSHCAVIATG